MPEQDNGLAAAIQGGLQEQVNAGAFVVPDQIVPVSLQQAIVEKSPEVVTPPVPAAEPVKPESTETVLSNNVPQDAPPTAEPVKTPDLTVDFNRMLEEKTGGKFKSYDEIKAVLEKPEPKLEFANENVSKINEYVSQGKTQEERAQLFNDYQATQTTDFNSLSAADQIAYHRQLQDPDLTDDLLQLEMNLDYRIDEWKDKPEDYEGGVEPKEITLAKMKFERDANKALKSNLEYQQKWATPQTKISAEQIAQQETAARQQAENWSKTVDTAAASLAKMSIKISDTESFDYAVPAEVQKQVSDIAKALWKDPNAAFRSFVNDKGEIDANGLLSMITKANSFDSVMKVVAQQARAKGSEQVVKDIKNISLTPDGKPVDLEGKSKEEQLSEQLASKLLRM
jgi:hypothetical protein